MSSKKKLVVPKPDGTINIVIPEENLCKRINRSDTPTYKYTVEISNPERNREGLPLERHEDRIITITAAPGFNWREIVAEVAEVMTASEYKNNAVGGNNPMLGTVWAEDEMTKVHLTLIGFSKIIEKSVLYGNTTYENMVCRTAKELIALRDLLEYRRKTKDIELAYSKTAEDFWPRD